MASYLSQRHIRLIINSYVFESYGNDDPVQFPDIDMMEVIQGRDGAISATDTAMLGGEVVVSLLPTSPSIRRCMQWYNEWRRTGAAELEGSYTNTIIGYSAQLKGGYMKRARPMVQPGVIYTVTFHFEELIPDFAGATFNSAPAVA